MKSVQMPNCHAVSEGGMRTVGVVRPDAAKRVPTNELAIAVGADELHPLALRARAVR